MTIRLHSTLLATTIAAIAAVGTATAFSIPSDAGQAPSVLAAKSDKIVSDRIIPSGCTVAALTPDAASCPSARTASYVTIAHNGEGTTTLTKVKRTSETFSPVLR